MCTKSFAVTSRRLRTKSEGTEREIRAALANHVTDLRNSCQQEDDAEHIGLKSDSSSTSENAMGILLYSIESCRTARLALQMIEERSESSKLLYTAL